MGNGSGIAPELESPVNPLVLHLIPCDDVRVDPDNPTCTHIDCLLTNIVSLDDPPYPLLKEMICVYVVLTEGRKTGRGQVRYALVDDLGVEIPSSGRRSTFWTSQRVPQSMSTGSYSGSRTARSHGPDSTSSSSAIMGT
jgi:hypothetical protein